MKKRRRQTSFKFQSKRLHPLRVASKKNKKGLASVILAPIRLIRIGTVYTNRKKFICQPFLSFFE